MAEWDYGGEQPYDDWSWDRGSIDFTPDYSYDYGGKQPYDDWSGRGDGGVNKGGTDIMSILASLGPAALKALPGLLSGATSLAGGRIGSNAAQDASRLQSDALTRGINLQEAQWLQQQKNQAPWLKAGQEALPELQRMAKEGAGDPFAAPNTPIWGQHEGYRPPNATPGWQPETVNVNDFRWQPGQGPRAQDFRYTPGQTPDAAQYQSGPPQLYQGAMPGTQVSQLTGQQVLDQDPGAAFRQSEARKALEGSAAARGDLLSGGTLQALQTRSQDLASQEYGNAFNRMMQRDTEQYGRNWGQYQQAWNQSVQGTQVDLATNAQNFGQAMSAAQLREQVNQVASQQGWSQAQAEAAFREQMAQASSKQWGDQVLQTSQWNQGQRQQYDQERYGREAAQAEQRYGRDVSENQQTYDRALQAWNSRNAQRTTDWNRQSTLAGLAQTATNQVGNQGLAAQDNLSRLLARQGEAQAQGPAASALAWQRGLTGATNQLPSILRSLNL
jgi:hypothetical protein